MVKRTRSCLGAPAFAASLAFAAPAQGDAPQVDPDSPAGTEYQLPLDEAREDAGAGRGGGTDGGTGAESGGSTGEAPLFGERVGDRTSGSAAESDNRGKAGGNESGISAEAERPSELPASTPRVRAQAASPVSGGRSPLAVAAGAGGVLLFGGLAGMLWRRRSVGG